MAQVVRHFFSSLLTTLIPTCNWFLFTVWLKNGRKRYNHGNHVYGDIRKENKAWKKQQRWLGTVVRECFDECFLIFTLISALFNLCLTTYLYKSFPGFWFLVMCGTCSRVCLWWCLISVRFVLLFSSKTKIQTQPSDEGRLGPTSWNGIWISDLLMEGWNFRQLYNLGSA